MLVDLLVTLLSFDAVLGGRADQQALEANCIATVITPAEAVILDTFQRLFELGQHALIFLESS